MFVFTLLLAFCLPFAFANRLASTNNVGSTPAQRRYVSAEQAQTIINAAVKNATALYVPENIAVVDPSGMLVAFLRQDNAFVGSIDLSIKKARTAVLFNGLSSEIIGQQAQPGNPLYGIQETNGGLVLFGGGFPIYVDGFLIGGVGVSGGSIEQDIQVAEAAIASVKGVSSPS